MTVSEHAGRLVWSDEFDGPPGAPPDPRWWRCETGAHGWGNGELQRYTDDPANACLDGHGSLVLRALEDGGAFTSARVTTKARMEFAYGRLECRARPPAGRGLWSAIWMLGGDIDARGWPACGEIDVMELLGAEPARVFGTVHSPGHSGSGGVGGSVVTARPLTDAFSIYAVDWTPASISWSLDGAVYFKVSSADFPGPWVFDHRFYVLINLAVGGTLGGAVGEDARFPSDFAIDYVRVFANSETRGP